MRIERHHATGVGLLLIHLIALAAFVPLFFTWSALFVALGLYAATAFGISLCYHRSLAHRGVRLSKPLEYFIATLGTLALQGGPIEWVSTHRKHHAFSDTDNDPHSMSRGFLWAHCAWLFRRNAAMPTPEEVRHYVPDLLSDPYYRWLDRNPLVLQVVLAIALFAVGGWPWVIWGIFARLVFCYHITWMINSVSHMVGYRNFKTTDWSRNVWWLALLSWGEGWHNNHHAFPFSARFGLRWFEFDPVWLVVRVLRVVHLAHEIKMPSVAMLKKLRGQVKERSPQRRSPRPVSS